MSQTVDVRVPNSPNTSPVHAPRWRKRQRGQVVVMFAGAILVFVGLLAVVVDVSWYWANSLKVQRAADAAALAGVVWLPSQPSTAASVATTEASRNGYTNGSGGVSVSAVQDSGDPNQLDVTLSAPVQTFFMRVFGINTLQATRTAHAVYVLPVPMGSPLNVFGYPGAQDLVGNRLNFWAAIQGTNTAKENGDPYATKVMQPDGSSNPQYVAPSTGDPGPYNYAISVPPGVTSPITVSLYDPEFCARNGQQDDTGDSVNLYPGGGGSTINTTFTLYNVNPQPLNFDMAGTPLASTAYPTSCSSQYVSYDWNTGDYVGKWLPFYTITSPQTGIYRLNVQTSGYGNGSNQFSIKAVAGSGGGTQPQIYGLGSMSIFANMNSGVTNLYMAQIAAIHAGKTMEIRLFDPGDANGNAYMQFLMPTATGYTAVPFRWYDAGTNDSNVSIPYPLPNQSTTTPNGPGIVTTSSGHRYFNGHWLVVDIPIPSDYTAPQNGWWKVAYTYYGGAAHDRTTWKVTIRGNPVHLVVP